MNAYHSLTLEDVDLLRRLAEGQTWATIATETHKAESAVRNRVRKIREYLGASCNVNAVYIAAKRGII